jgi:hypothetical protein
VAAAVAGEGLGGLEHVRHVGLGELDGVDEHVARDHDLVAATAGDQGLVPDGVPRRRYHRDPVAAVTGEAHPALHLLELARPAQRRHDELLDRSTRDRRGLVTLEDVAGVGERRPARRIDRPAEVVLVQVGQHHGVDVSGLDDGLDERVGQPARNRCPARRRAVRRADAGVDQRHPAAAAADGEALGALHAGRAAPAYVARHWLRTA